MDQRVWKRHTTTLTMGNTIHSIVDWLYFNIPFTYHLLWTSATVSTLMSENFASRKFRELRE